MEKRKSNPPAIKAAVVRVNSPPGGSVAASQQIAAAFEDFSKPLVISMGICRFGGYYISAPPADGIVAQPGTLTGSIGGVISFRLSMTGGALREIGPESGDDQERPP